MLRWELVADTLRPSRERTEWSKTKTMSERIHRKKFAVQALEELQRKGILFFSLKTMMEWEWNFQNESSKSFRIWRISSRKITSKIKTNAPPLLQHALILTANTSSTVDFDTLHELSLWLELYLACWR